MKTYKVVNRFHDAQNGYVMRKVDDELVLTDERGEELTAKGLVQAVEDDSDLGGSDASTEVSGESKVVDNSQSAQLLDTLAESLKAAVEAKKASKGKGKPVVTKEEKNV